MVKFEAVRMFRTPHSERFVLQNEGKDFASLDFHYLLNGTVAATVIIFEDSGIAEKDIPELLVKIDDVLLPEVSMEEGNIFFAVVIGHVAGNYTPEHVDAGSH